MADEDKARRYAEAKALAMRIALLRAAWCPRCECLVLLANDRATCERCDTEIGVCFAEFVPRASA